ncbi:transposable element Tc1 transposase [Trichonephila clavipes]|nr:transposable element Tc1 transposase [Trichonephila clavipes]
MSSTYHLCKQIANDDFQHDLFSRILPFSSNYRKTASRNPPDPTNLASKCVLTIIEDVSKDVQGSVLLLLPLLHDTGSQPEVMICRADPFGSRTALVIIRCTLTAQRCVDDILRNVALSWPYFSEDKTSLHAVRFSMNCFMAFETVPWPARSPDISSIEHVWDIMEMQLSLPGNVNDLAQ